MAQTFYIENDEEIISLISRLRKSPAQENFFVFPKHALILQSIVNLRLFQREADKIGKKIVIVTQDDTGKRLAEKAGVPTESYVENTSEQRTTHLELVPPEINQSNQKSEMRSIPPMKKNILRGQDVGSSDFYGATAVDDVTVLEPLSQTTEQILRIRDASPPKQTSLNSKRVEEEESARQGVPNLPFHPSVTMGKGVTFTMPRTMSPPNVKPLSVQIPYTPPPAAVADGREARLKNFYTGKRENNTAFSPSPDTIHQAGNRSTSAPVASKKVGLIFFLLGGISLLSFAGVFFFFFLPKAEIHVTPQRITKSVDLQFDGRSQGSVWGEDSFPVRLVEKRESVTYQGQATGTSSGAAQKARGLITVANEYNAEPQTLVATTRFQSLDGKIFRLADGAVVPGMKNGQPGTIDVTVIAEEAGTVYNITPTSFTIPGFKGSPKYAKFSAKSSKLMSGGGDASGSGMTIISKTDLENAMNEAKQRAKVTYLEDAKKELQPNEKILEDLIEIIPQNKMAPPLAGTAATSFDYQDDYTAKSFAFSEDSLKEKIRIQGEGTINGVLFRPTAITLSYSDSVANYSDGTLRLKVHAVVVSESVIDRDTLTNDFLGKDESGINTILTGHPEIKKVEVNFKPQWFSAVVPTTRNRVLLFVEPGEE